MLDSFIASLKWLIQTGLFFGLVLGCVSTLPDMDTTMFGYPVHISGGSRAGHTYGPWILGGSIIGYALAWHQWGAPGSSWVDRRLTGFALRVTARATRTAIWTMGAVWLGVAAILFLVLPFWMGFIPVLGMIIVFFAARKLVRLATRRPME